MSRDKCSTLIPASLPAHHRKGQKFTLLFAPNARSNALRPWRFYIFPAAPAGVRGRHGS